MKQLSWNVAGDPHSDTPILIADNPPGGTPIPTRFEGVAGTLPNRLTAADIPADLTGGATLYWGPSKRLRVILPPGDGAWEAGAPPCLPPELTPEDEALVYGPASVFLDPLEVRGQFYYRAGQPHTIIGSSEFRLYERLLRGMDIQPVLDQRRDLGINLVRVWLMNTSVGHLLPWEWPDFYDRLPAFLGLCGSYGFDVEFTIGTQWADLMPQVTDQQRHWDCVCDAVAPYWCFLEGCNEYDSYPGNRYHPDLQLRKPSGARFNLCAGSNGSDSDILKPVLDSSRYHSNDAPEWWRRQAHNPMEGADQTGKPCWANENTRPDRDFTPHHFYDAAAGGALLHAGSVLHSNEGKDSVLYGSQTLACAVQHVAGARSVDLSQRIYPYVHRTDLESPTVIRVYQRGSAIVPIRA